MKPPTPPVGVRYGVVSGLYHALGRQQLEEVRRDVVYELETAAKTAARRTVPADIVPSLGHVLTMIDKRLGQCAPDLLANRQRVDVGRSAAGVRR